MLGTDKPAKPPCLQGDTASLSLIWEYIGQEVEGKLADWASIGERGAPVAMGLQRKVTLPLICCSVLLLVHGVGRAAS